MTRQKLNEEHEILRRFMAVVVSSAFRNSLTLVLTRHEPPRLRNNQAWPADIWEFPNLVVLNFCVLLRTCMCTLFALICVFLCPTAFRATAFGNSREKSPAKS